MNLDEATLAFHAEGGANVIYRMAENPDYLARFRKTGAAQQASAADLYAFIETLKPLLPTGAIVDMQLVPIPPAVLTSINAELRAHDDDGRRDPKRAGLYLDEGETHALLVESMLPVAAEGEHHRIASKVASLSLSPADGSAMIEFKPKWLVQSPDAPANWRYCRTCALYRMRHSGDKPKARSSRFCPLSLNDMAANEASVTRAIVPDAVDDVAGFSAAALRAVVAAVLRQSEIIPALRAVQVAKGVSLFTHAPEDVAALQLAMAVRDCTLFVRIAPATDARPGRLVAVVDGQAYAADHKLADLDIKRADHRLAYWQSVERELIDGGWYTTVDEAFPPCRP
ncbi:inositol-pentakisphosphate 2-kinase [Dipodascopsis tothii]|uniref:inositol-pentakisphosphate 2-kinase n=1 Tax=Dipodascopsis tothii TaxID=44089 RepID=UPI0034CFEDF0